MSIRFKNLFMPLFKPLFGIHREELVGIDFSGNELKIVRGIFTVNKREVVSVVRQDIQGLNDSEIAEIIRESFYKLGGDNPKVINIIPSRLVITRNIEIPSTKPQEIKEIINLQASRYTPYSREEIIVDYVDISTYKHSYTKILLVIVPAAVVRRQFDILSRAGVKLEKVVLASEALALAVPELLKLDTGSSPVAVVHIDEDSSDFTLIFKNKPVFIRNIPIGTRHFLEKREHERQEFAAEVKKSLEAYQSENVEKMPDLLVLTGAIEELGDLEPVLAGSFSYPIRLTAYAKNIEVSPELAMSGQLRERSSFLNVIACLFTADAVRVNFISEEVKLRKTLEERGRDLMKTGILALALFVLTFSIFISKIYFKKVYLNKLEREYKTLSQEARKLEVKDIKVQRIKSYFRRRGYSLEIFTELSDLVPLNLKITELRFDREGQFTVRGTAEFMALVFSFVDNLEQSRYFKDVKTRYTTKRKDGLKDMTDFEINCELVKDWSG